MLDLDLQSLKDQLTLQIRNDKRYVYDPIRHKYLLLTPEELVRRLLIAYLLTRKGYQPKRFAVEKQLEVFGLSRRFDILIFGPQLQPFLLAECKAPQVPIDQDTFEQISRYNLPVKAPYLLLTNGQATYCCRMDYANRQYHFIDELPALP